MPEAGLDEVKVGWGRVLVFLLDHLAGDPDEQDDGVRRLQRHFGEFGKQLGDGQPVLLPDVVEQAQRVVLHHHIVRAVHARRRNESSQINRGFFFTGKVRYAFQSEQEILFENLGNEIQNMIKFISNFSLNNISLFVSISAYWGWSRIFLKYGRNLAKFVRSIPQFLISCWYFGTC